MAALLDLDAGMGHEGRRTPVQRVRALGQGTQRIERGQRAREPRQCRDRGLQRIEQLRGVIV